ncbi:MAG TPA: tetratricopeptide repeat protein [Kofleriaceae bacterium]|nr:tetratricopeptide repeat protein [Kofleriaceae bacterium]
MTPDDLDDLTRALPAYRPSAAQVEQVRTAVLAAAPGVPRLGPASRRVSRALIAGAALAAAAGLAAAGVGSLLGGRDHAGSAPAVVPDAGDGRATLAPPATPDAPRLTPSPPVVPSVAPQPAPQPQSIPRHDPSPHEPRFSTSVAPTVPPPPPAPGEAEFRAGWAALQASEPRSAAASFAAARQTRGSVLVEDASFWEGIALARAGERPAAIAALRRFVGAYPSSSRAGEAAAKLGWLLYETGDLDGARPYFQSAVDDVVPKVRQSARAGLDAIDHPRGTP